MWESDRSRDGGRAKRLPADVVSRPSARFAREEPGPKGPHDVPNPVPNPGHIALREFLRCWGGRPPTASNLPE